MKLIVVESPTKARTLSRFLGRDYQIEASMGHIRDLPKKELGVEIDNDFQPVYVVDPKKKTVVQKLKQAAKKVSEVILATDLDREGEAIAFHVQYLLGDGHKFSRIVFHEITQSAIETALKNPGQVDLKLVEAQQARRILDRLVGYKLSPVLWRKIRKGLSAGRVQSVAVRLVVEREKEIEAFKPQEFWEIIVTLKKDTDQLVVQLIKIDGKKLNLKNQAGADAVVADLNAAQYQVDQVETSELKRPAYPPLITSTMQRLSANRLGWSAKKTMRQAQVLYEKGLITYHRTDSVNMAAEAVAKARVLIGQKYGQEYLPERPIFYKRQSKMVQGAHEAIRPTTATQMSVTEEAGQAGDKLYRLIWQRFVASQMKPAVFAKTKILVAAKNQKNYELKAESEKLIFAGWLKVADGFQGQTVALPDLKTGDVLELIKVSPQQKFTQPPARFTEATLIKELEKLGIGRPSTYAPILSTIQDRMYVEKKDRQLIPTVIGTSVTEFLLEHFNSIMDYDFTAKMEDDLDGIAIGKLSSLELLKSFYLPFNDKLNEVTKNAQRVKIATEKTGERCPECRQGEVVVRLGRFGRFLSCSRFPDCKYTANFKEVVSGVVCPDCRGEVVVKHTKKGKSFYGCANYPKCQWASWKKPKSLRGDSS